MKIAILGGGNMGTAFARAFLSAKVLSASELSIVEARSERREELKTLLPGCLVVAAPAELADAVDVLFLAVKPQDFAASADACCDVLGPESLVISIMAGVSIETMENKLRPDIPIVRSMPNMPAQVQRGVTAFICSEKGDAKSKELAVKLLGCCGAVVEIGAEELLNTVTAISGSGPAYVFYFIEHMIAAGVELGVSEDDARALVRHTFEGALALWEQSGDSPQTLRKQVTSKGGTTAAALEVFEEKGLGPTLEEAVHAACKRARELSKG